MKLALLLLLACGAAPAPAAPGVPILEPGRYQVTASAPDAGCALLPPAFSKEVEVDETGAVKSPVAGVGCSTAYDPAGVSLSCGGFGVSVDARGTLRPGGAVGTGEARGVPGCEPIAFRWWAVRRSSCCFSAL